MRVNTTKPVLEFDEPELTDSLSAAVVVGEHLWLASDEVTSVERLSSDDGITFRNHKSFELEDVIDLPAQGTDFDQEIDIEGLDYEDSYLWLVGSHSIKRKKIDQDAGSNQKKVKKLAKTEIEGNRFMLARIPLVESGDEANKLVRAIADPNNASHTLSAGQLGGDVKRNTLIDAINQADDPHFASFLTIPGKDNGFDIEGLAVAGDRIFMGLRGPVLRGWAAILEVSVQPEDPFQLTLKTVGPDGRPYKKHFLDLNGLGLRDLCVDGDDLLILAGPTMNLDGPVAVFRWRDGLQSSEEQVIFSDQLKQLFVVPNGVGFDHAEGMTLLDTKPQQLLIVYDSPSDQRKIGPRAVTADVFELPVT